MANTSDELVNLMQGVQGDPNDPNVQKQKLALLFSRWGKPAIQPSSAPDVIDETPGAGADGGNGGYSNAKPVPGSSEMSSGSSPDLAEPKPANPMSLGQAQRVKASTQPPAGASTQPEFAGADLESHVGLPVPPRAEAESGSTADLENHAESSVPGMFLAAANAQKPHGVLGILGAIGKQVLPRIGNMGYALTGHDPREMALREQEQQFGEETERQKMSPEYQRQIAEATTKPEMVTSPNASGGGYSYETVDPFSGRGTPTGIAAPSPEKTPAQLLAEFQQNHPQALIKGTADNTAFEELAESLRAFPSQQAQIHANAEMYVGRLGVQRAVIQANGLIKAMQGRNIGEQTTQQMQALNNELNEVAKGWADYYVQHPYLQSMGIGPDAQGQAEYVSNIMDQMKELSLESNQTTQRIPGAAKVVPPIIHDAANAGHRGKVATQAHISDYARQKGISVQQAEQEFRKSGYTVIPAPMTR
jgi:hypothetical protein